MDKEQKLELIREAFFSKLHEFNDPIELVHFLLGLTKAKIKIFLINLLEQKTNSRLQSSQYEAERAAEIEAVKAEIEKM